MLDLAEIVPAEEPRLMAITKGGPHRVIAHQVPAFNADFGEFFRPVPAILVPEDVFFAYVLGARGVLTKEAGREVAFVSVIPEDGEIGADQLNVRGLHPV